MDLAAQLMSRLGIEMKRNRERYWDREDYVVRRSRRRGNDEASLFFRTEGCRYDARGGCTMCDYSVGPPTTSEHMIDSVRRGLEDLPVDLRCVLVSPSGSLLDEDEVPLEARQGIFDLLGATRYPEIAFETRAEIIGDTAMRDCRTRLGDRSVRVYVGLESSDPWVSTYALNKDLEGSTFIRAMATLAANSAYGVANILLGAPFLSASEAITDAEATVRWALQAGARDVCLFPCHVKRWTQIEWLYENGAYRPPSLWAFTELLARLGPEIAQRVEIAWYTDYGAFNIIESPRTCAKCQASVTKALDAFAESSEFSIIEDINANACKCRAAWLASLDVSDGTDRYQRAVRSYSQIGQNVFPRWWDKHGADVRECLRQR